MRQPETVIALASVYRHSADVMLPNASSCRVDREKITGYLLCPTHPDGAAKAHFFRRFGFDLENWKELAAALRAHGQSHAVAEVVESSHGIRYSVGGPLRSPDGRNPTVRTVWIVERGSRQARLITAYPA